MRDKDNADVFAADCRKEDTVPLHCCKHKEFAVFHGAAAIQKQ